LLEDGEIGEDKLTAKAVQALLDAGSAMAPVTAIAVAEVALASFDELLGGNAEVLQ
jgi:hypothetical protein